MPLILIFVFAEYREILEYWFWYCSDTPRCCWSWPSFRRAEIKRWKKHCLLCSCQTTTLPTSPCCCRLRCWWTGTPPRPGAPAVAWWLPAVVCPAQAIKGRGVLCAGAVARFGGRSQAFQLSAVAFLWEAVAPNSQLLMSLQNHQICIVLCST